ncbi:MAG: hypothetical protein COB30_012360 [Ectothiorhodospiraceae bacterium]|nr:hypothetical protein [Ectothiorhodospiraceae bacterium]
MIYAAPIGLPCVGFYEKVIKVNVPKGQRGPPGRQGECPKGDREGRLGGKVNAPKGQGRLGGNV